MSRVDLLQGTLDMLILKTLSGGALHGFAIVKKIRTLTDEVIKVGEGSLYPSLYRMEKRGWVRSEWGTTPENRRARFYKLTKPGRKQLDGEAVNWDRLSHAVSKLMQTA